jgi:hypothetical protein
MKEYLITALIIFVTVVVLEWLGTPETTAWVIALGWQILGVLFDIKTKLETEEEVTV